MSDNGPYAVRQGALAALAVHEAAHAVAIVSMGDRLDSIEVALDFERAYDGGVGASVRGLCKTKVEAPSTIICPPSAVPLAWSGQAGLLLAGIFEKSDCRMRRAGWRAEVSCSSAADARGDRR